MRKGFFPRLAATGLKNNRQTYLPYFLTCTGTVMMFYNMCALTYHTSTIQDGNLSSIMGVGMGVTAIFAVIFLFYTNSFVIKRRKKEFGLYNILGLEKKHIGITMFFESLYVYLGSTALGVGLGILFNKLVTLILYRILNFDPNFQFEVSVRAIFYCIALFAGIAVVNLLFNLLQVQLARPVQLLQGSSAGEKEPKANWFIAILGVLTLGAGYWIALTIASPMDALAMFFVAVILVIIGTYLLFCAGSIVILKLMRKNKKYYYKPAHFTTVSGMIYRMKQNAAGLASICILSTAVLVMISTTVSMFVGMEDVLHTRFPQEIDISATYLPGADFDREALLSYVEDTVTEAGRQTENLEVFDSLTVSTQREGNTFVSGSDSDVSSAIYLLVFLSAQDYTALTGEQVSVGDGEIYAFGDVFESREAADWESIEIFGNPFRLAGTGGMSPEMGTYAAYLAEVCYLVVEDLDAAVPVASAAQAEYGDLIDPFTCHIAFDTDGTEEEKAALAQTLSQIRNMGFPEAQEITFSSMELSRDSFFDLYGGLFFLGIFLGALFLMATVLIIYYKQIVEGYDDKERFAIMQKVGMSRREVKGTVRTQVLIVFFIPLLAAAVHIAVAFPILTKLLALLNLQNVSLFGVCTVCTVLVFALIYAIVYSMTAKVYYRIVYRRV